MCATIRLYIAERMLLWKKKPVETASIFACTIFAGRGNTLRFTMGIASIPDAKRERPKSRPASIGNRSKMKIKLFQINKEPYGPRRSFTIRFPEALFERLSQLAQENGISFNFLVLQCCKYSLKYLKPFEEE